MWITLWTYFYISVNLSCELHYELTFIYPWVYRVNYFMDLLLSVRKSCGLHYELTFICEYFVWITLWTYFHIGEYIVWVTLWTHFYIREYVVWISYLWVHRENNIMNFYISVSTSCELHFDLTFISVYVRQLETPLHRMNYITLSHQSTSVDGTST